MLESLAVLKVFFTIVAEFANALGDGYRQHGQSNFDRRTTDLSRSCWQIGRKGTL